MSARTIRLFFFLFAFYLVASTGYLLHRSFAETKTSITFLQAGENSLLSDPTAATKNFQLSEQAAEKSLGEIRGARWWDRVISFLPPLRWQVQLTKASYSLAEAGQSTINLQSSLSAINPEASMGLDPLVATGNQYLTWYASAQPTVVALHAQLASAQANFAPIPNWIFLNQSDNFTKLQTQLTGLTNLVASESQVGSGISNLTKNAQTALVVLLPASATDSGSLGTLTLDAGEITALSFKPLPQNVLSTYQRGEEQNAFWPSTARAVALSLAGASEPAGAIMVVDPALIRNLLTISGPLQLQGVANPVIDASTLTSTQVSPDELLYKLLASLLEPSHKPAAVSELLLGMNTGALQLWSSELSLIPSLNQLADTIPPQDHSNWLRLIPEKNTNLNVILTQKYQVVTQNTLQTINVSGSNVAPHVALPFEAQVVHGAPSTIRSGFQEATLEALGSGFTISYTLPSTTDKPDQILYMVPLIGNQKVTAFGQEQLVTKDTVLTP